MSIKVTCRRLLLFVALLSVSVCSHAQFMVTDLTNLTQSIINSTDEMVHTAKTAATMLDNFRETAKIYEQGREYYERLRGISNTVKSARKVQQCILMLGQISDTYVSHYGKFLSDENFSTDELRAMASVYSKLLEEGSAALGDLQGFVNPSDLSMTDHERLDMVDRCHKELTKLNKLADYFTRRNIAVSYGRSKKKTDRERVKALYGE